MTIAEKLYTSDKDTLLKIVTMYQLVGLERLYFPDRFASQADTDTEDDMQEYTRLMMPGAYTGRTERRRGAVTQPHRPVIK
jgi:hypothetical protein